MKKLKLLVAEGNVPTENEFFESKGIRTHTESLKESISNYYSDFEIDVIQPTINLSLNEVIPNLKKLCRPIFQVMPKITIWQPDYMSQPAFCSFLMFLGEGGGENE